MYLRQSTHSYNALSLLLDGEIACQRSSSVYLVALCRRNSRKDLVCLLLRRVIDVGLGQQALDAEQKLLDCDSRLPALVLIQQ